MKLLILELNSSEYSSYSLFIILPIYILYHFSVSKYEFYKQ